MEAPVKKVEPPRVPVTPLPAAVVTAPPPPAEQGCGSDDPPLYCSPVFWSVVGVVVVAAGTTGGILGWCYASGPCKGAEEPELPDRVAVVVGGGDLSSAFGLTF